MDVIELATGISVHHMDIAEAQHLVGEGLMFDEIMSTRDLCSDDPEIVEACDILIENLTKQ